MIFLTVPHADGFNAWLDAVADFGAGPMDGSGFSPEAPPVPTREGFESYLADRLNFEAEGAVLPEGLVPCSYRWVTDDSGAILGFLSFRHRLTEYLLNYGGNIGYSVRPSARRRGVATQALAQGLNLAAELRLSRVPGLQKVLVTCTEDNVGSRGVIEANQGVYEDSRNNYRRYWFTLQA